MNEPHEDAGTVDGFRVVLWMEPPTVTHQAKKIRVVRGRRVLADDPRLKQARENYVVGLRVNRKYKPKKPLKGPLRLRLLFGFAGERQEWHVEKPDLDNLAKTLQDVLAAEGWIAPDQKVSSIALDKISAWEPFIAIAADTLTQADFDALLAEHLGSIEYRRSRV
jgi:Holliday junction resolvase RusA-like endonuclease